jgi:hypothetical protein
LDVDGADDDFDAAWASAAFRSAIVWRLPASRLAPALRASGEVRN